MTPPSTLPSFTETPSDATLYLGEPLLLRAAAPGEGSLSFAWTKDGDPVPAATIVPPLAMGAVSLEAGQFLIPFNGIIGRTYLLEAQATLDATEWITVSEQDADASSVFSVPVPEAEESRLFRVRTR